MDEIISLCLEAIDPYRLVKKNLRVKQDCIFFGDEKYCLGRSGRVFVIGLVRLQVVWLKLLGKCLENILWMVL